MLCHCNTDVEDESPVISNGPKHIIVVGGTGVGKSALAQSYANSQMEPTTGIPRTKETKAYTCEYNDTELLLWDTPGFGINDYGPATDIIDLLLEKTSANKITKPIDMGWYVIGYYQSDVEADIRFIQQLREKIPVIVVLAKATSPDPEGASCYRALVEALETEEGQKPVPIIPVLSKDMTLIYPSGQTTVAAFGCNDLMTASKMTLPTSGYMLPYKKEEWFKWVQQFVHEQWQRLLQRASEKISEFFSYVTGK